MPVKIALAGNPNSGKTTVYNSLTGSRQYVGNWPGVTVEKKEGLLRGRLDTLVDLPGIYSLSPYSLEEVVTRDFLLSESPDVIVNLVDASNIERNLYLTTQLLELDIPVVIALNMMDVAAKKGDRIDIEKLSAALGCEIVPTSALKGKGLSTLSEAALKAAAAGGQRRRPVKFSAAVERTITDIEHIIFGKVPGGKLRWHAIKIFERDERVLSKLRLTRSELAAVEGITAVCEQRCKDSSEGIIIGGRYRYIEELIRGCVVKNHTLETVSDKIDLILTDRVLALPIFALIMWFIYYIAVSSVGAAATGWTNEVLFGRIIIGGTQKVLAAAGAADWVLSLVCEGLLGGVGAVLGFVPQLVILFFFLSILEDCGYMARIAFIMDKLFRKFGLSGKSFIPMLISSGCGVPGIMASRTIESENDRRMTIMVTTFIPCGAKLPVIALMGGAIFKGSAWIAPSIYFLGIAMVVISGVILKKTRFFAGDTSHFVMELPRYHLPRLKNVLSHVWERSRSFIVKAGTVIFTACGAIWFLSNFGWDLSLCSVDQSESILASIGGAVAPLFAPLGFGNWRAAVSTLTGIVAKENLVATFGVLSGLGEASENDPELWRQMASMFTAVSAYSFMAFNMLCAPCAAAIGAIRREMMSLKWTLAAVGYQTLLAYAVSFVIYQLGSLFLGNAFGAGALAALAVLACAAFLLLRKGEGRQRERSSLWKPSFAGRGGR